MHNVDKRSKTQINNDIYAISICVSTANFAEYIIKSQIIKALCTSFIWIFLFFASKSALNSQIISSAYALLICRTFCHCRHGTVRSSIYDFNSTFPHYESTSKPLAHYYLKRAVLGQAAYRLFYNRADLYSLFTAFLQPFCVASAPVSAWKCVALAQSAWWLIYSCADLYGHFLQPQRRYLLGNA